MNSVAVLLLSILPAFAPTAQFQGSAAPAQSAPALPSAPPIEDYSPDYQLGPGDLVQINVSGVREFDVSPRVSNSGRIRVPYVGVMFVAGLTTLQLEQDIARQIKEHELVNEPSVRVSIEEFRASPVYVVGEVGAPGQFVTRGELFVLDLISKAGGLLSGAESEGFLYRRKPVQPEIEARMVDTGGAPESALANLPIAHNGSLAAPPYVPSAEATDGGKSDEVIRLDLEKLRDGSKPELNMKLRGGDVLVVPRRKPMNVYVIGDVLGPGIYALPRWTQVTASQAMIYAGGPLPTASLGNSFVMRHDSNGERQAIPINFKEVLAGREPDFPIKADDIIFVPNSPVKTVTTGLLNMIPRLIQQWLIF